MTHYLKTWPQYFERIKSGEKTFEVRKNDRDFQTGDILVLEKYDPNPSPANLLCQSYNDPEREVARVTYLLNGGQFGIEQGYCVMGIQVVNDIVIP